MYTLWIRNTNNSNFEEMCIYNDESTLEEFKIESASLDLEENSAGSLDLRVPVTNVGYNYFELLSTEIKIVKNGAVYWIGRLLTSSEDFEKNLELKFEGTYNYLMDSVLLQKHMICYPTEWFKFIVDSHNKNVTSNTEYWKVIQIGTLDPNINTGSQTDFYSDYETCLDLVNNVCEGWSMHPVFTYTLSNHVTYIDRSTSPVSEVRINYDGTTGTPADPDSIPKYWNLTISLYKDYLTYGDRTPTITFGENLEDYTKENEVDELATVVIPKGGAYSDEQKADIIASFTTVDPLENPANPPIEGLDYNCTVWHANNHSEYIVTTDSSMLTKFGVICKIVEFTDCTDPAKLLVLGQDYLRDQKWVGTSISIKAIDASLLGRNVEQIKIGVGVKCYSKPHNLDYTYPCTSINEDLLDPSATTFNLGIKDNSYMTNSSRRTDDALRDLIIENRRREQVIKENTNKSIKDSYDDPTIWTDSELYDYFDEQITEGMSHAEDIATGDAKKYALSLLNIFDQQLNNNNKGYVFFKKTRATGETEDHIYEICISDTYDYTSSTANIWRWNKTGLYFIQGAFNEDTVESRGESGYQTQDRTLRIGITYDGQIVADRITAGRLDAGIVRAGYLCSQDFDPNDSSQPWKSASFVLDIEHGTMLAKTGTLLFNCTNQLDASMGSARCGTNNFVYLSNLSTGERTGGQGYLNISDHSSNDWLFILGSSFGVDRFGRAFMREGIIGATGGIWNCKFFNDSYPYCWWVAGSNNTSVLKYKISFNTTSYRPMGAQVPESNYYSYPVSSQREMLLCRWRIARYDSNNNLVFMSKMHTISPPIGQKSFEYTEESFYPAITYSGTPEEAEESATKFYQGEIFPIFYNMCPANWEGRVDYTENIGGVDIDFYILNVDNLDIRITHMLDDNPQYTSYGGGGYATGFQSQGAVYIGSGYLYYGEIGNNSSFSLSAVNRSATVANNVKDDWRFTVGSRLGVTSNGTLYCNGAVLNNVTAAGTVSARTLDSNVVGGVKINDTHGTSGTVYTYNFGIRISYSYGVDTAFMWLASGSTTTGEGSIPMQPSPDQSASSSISQANFYDDIDLKLTVTSYFVISGHPDELEVVHSYEFSYDKDTSTGYTGEVNPQVISLGLDDWTASPQSGYVFSYATFVLEMTNERTGENIRPTWSMGSSSIQRTSSTLYTTGVFTVSKVVSNDDRDCMNIGRRDLITNGYLGGPLQIDYISHAYITTLHTSQSGSGSSRLYKEEIQPLTDIYDRIFDGLVPKSYYLKNDERRVRHTGFILEDIGNMLMTNGIGKTMFGAYSPNDNGFGGELYYLDFIALNTSQIQKLKRRIAELEERLDEVERNENSSNT